MFKGCLVHITLPNTFAKDFQKIRNIKNNGRPIKHDIGKIIRKRFFTTIKLIAKVLALLLNEFGVYKSSIAPYLQRVIYLVSPDISMGFGKYNKYCKIDTLYDVWIV